MLRNILPTQILQGDVIDWEEVEDMGLLMVILSFIMVREGALQESKFLIFKRKGFMILIPVLFFCTTNRFFLSFKKKKKKNRRLDLQSPSVVRSGRLVIVWRYYKEAGSVDQETLSGKVQAGPHG